MSKEDSIIVLDMKKCTTSSGRPVTLCVAYDAHINTESLRSGDRTSAAAAELLDNECMCAHGGGEVRRV